MAEITLTVCTETMPSGGTLYRLRPGTLSLSGFSGGSRDIFRLVLPREWQGETVCVVFLPEKRKEIRTILAYSETENYFSVPQELSQSRMGILYATCTTAAGEEIETRHTRYRILGGEDVPLSVCSCSKKQNIWGEFVESLRSSVEDALTAVAPETVAANAAAAQKAKEEAEQIFEGSSAIKWSEIVGEAEDTPSYWGSPPSSAKGVYNVEDYGATDGGSVDCTDAFTSAINAANTAGGGVVYVPTGTYLITQMLPALQRGVVVRGAARGASAGTSRIYFKPTAEQSLFAVGGSDNTADGFQLRDLTAVDISGRSDTTFCTIIHGVNGVVRDLTVSNFAHGFDIDTVKVSGALSGQLFFHNLYITSLKPAHIGIWIHGQGLFSSRFSDIQIAYSRNSDGQAILMNGNRIRDIHFDYLDIAGHYSGVVLDGQNAVADSNSVNKLVEDIFFTRVIVDGYGGNGIQILNTGDSSMINITMAWLDYNAQGAVTEGNGIFVNQAKGVSVYQAQIREIGYKSESSSNAVYFANSSDCTVSGAMIRNVAQPIRLYNCTDIMLSENNLVTSVSPNAGVTVKDAIRLESCKRCAVSENIAKGSYFTSLLNAGGSCKKILARGNISVYTEQGTVNTGTGAVNANNVNWGTEDDG